MSGQEAKNEMLNKHRETLVAIASGLTLALFQIKSNSIITPPVAVAELFSVVSLVISLTMMWIVHRHWLIEVHDTDIFIIKNKLDKKSPAASALIRKRLFNGYWTFSHCLLPSTAIYFLLISWVSLIVLSVLPISFWPLFRMVFCLYAGYFIFSYLFTYVWVPREAVLNTQWFVIYQVFILALMLLILILPICLLNTSKTMNTEKGLRINKEGVIYQWRIWQIER